MSLIGEIVIGCFWSLVSSSRRVLKYSTGAIYGFFSRLIENNAEFLKDIYTIL
jgi:hypothetical protein